ncbi:hypothetical protein K435DRAFT_759939 [Dendrothele bispora CBS 962.96]|uniref:SprT-like domain-containing protein n=1 Tax=Dendrothele bispora (strain CBS 962.96) TaxID=1314807 RepID=A0A4S8LNP0_DENBC|nr:hypothetical protein K435DRAFT_759939 [Dendrothele bispora CBS 962.96]
MKDASVIASTSTPTRKIGESQEVVPDSEEERKRSLKNEPTKFRTMAPVIDISSDEDDLQSPDKDPSSTPTLPGSWPRSTEKQKVKSFPAKTTAKKKKFPLSRRVIESSDSEDDYRAKEIIELCSDSDTPPEPEWSPLEKAKLKASPKLSLYADTDDENEFYFQRDEAILVLNEPKSHRKTLKLTEESLSYSPSPRSPRKRSQPNATTVFTPTTPAAAIETPSKTSSASRSPMKKRMSAKAKKEERFNELKKYAEELFEELNQKIFEGKLPDAPLQWNPRLLTTAGKAQWHRSREGIETSSIQLATKILVDEDRIRKTLAHEMCHLACWVIDRNPKEAHGSLFKSWARRVEAKRPDITVSVTHDYEITYPYNWKCAGCGLNYGRFTKSINPDKHGCGTCSSRNLIPQFEVRTRTPKTPRISRMAAGKPRGSPSVLSTTPSASSIPQSTQISLSSDDDEIGVSCIQHSPGVVNISDSDSDIEFIATKLATTTIVTT